jgi:hypothetical protein
MRHAVGGKHVILEDVHGNIENFHASESGKISRNLDFD